jgi:hypothetical protein
MFLRVLIKHFYFLELRGKLFRELNMIFRFASSSLQTDYCYPLHCLPKRTEILIRSHENYCEVMLHCHNLSPEYEVQFIDTAEIYHKIYWPVPDCLSYCRRLTSFNVTKIADFAISKLLSSVFLLIMNKCFVWTLCLRRDKFLQNFYVYLV